MKGDELLQNTSLQPHTILWRRTLCWLERKLKGNQLLYIITQFPRSTSAGVNSQGFLLSLPPALSTAAFIPSGVLFSFSKKPTGVGYLIPIKSDSSWVHGFLLKILVPFCSSSTPAAFGLVAVYRCVSLFKLRQLHLHRQLYFSVFEISLLELDSNSRLSSQSIVERREDK